MEEPTKDERPKYAGMTVNERLFTAGLFDEFDEAARRRNRDLMIELLKRVEIETAEWSVDTILADPERYGY